MIRTRALCLAMVIGLGSGAAAQTLDPSSCRLDGVKITCLTSDGLETMPPSEFERRVAERPATPRAQSAGRATQPVLPTQGRAIQAAPSVPTPAASASLSPTPARSPTQTTGAPDTLAEVLDDIISVDSRGWVMNRYVAGSVSNVKITDRSADGRSMTVYGEYLYNGTSRGHVRVKITDNDVECLKFWDSPSCRPLGRSHGQDVLVGLVAAAAASPSGGSGSASTSSGTGQSCYEDCYPAGVDGQSVPFCRMVCD